MRGLFFGKERGTTSVYFSDLKVPGSAYEKWSSREIVLRVPEGVDVGQVRVRNSYGFSNGILFTGQDAIPVIAEDARVPAEPVLPFSNRHAAMLKNPLFQVLNSPDCLEADRLP